MELSCCTTVSHARAGSNPLLVIPFSLSAADLSNLGEWLQINVQKDPPSSIMCMPLLEKKESLLWEVLLKMNWGICATDGTNQTSLVNVSVFHHEIINNNYYRVPSSWFFFFPPLIYHKGKLSIFVELELLMASLDFDS